MKKKNIANIGLVTKDMHLLEVGLKVTESLSLLNLGMRVLSCENHT